MQVDLILVGGGLANGLIAHRLKQLRPSLRIVLLERGPTVGGNHTWSFHESDLTAAQLGWLAPFVVHRWPAYDVRFGGRARTVPIGYLTATATRMHQVLTATLGEHCRQHAEVSDVTPAGVQLASGERITAAAVIDGRGDRASPSLQARYQKFHGLEVRTRAPHGLVRPVVMDAAVAQIEGYRFVYLLPFGPRELLIEDTRYADAPALDLAAMRRAIDEYARASGWVIEEVIRTESGVLPVILDGDIDEFWQEVPSGVPTVGLRAALFHPTTSYSLPDAVRCADRLAELTQLSSTTIDAAVRGLSTELWHARRFYRLLNRMLFLAARPAERYRVLQRFYELPDALIGRFYAGQVTTLDKIRLLSGRPPVPVMAALRCLAPASARQRLENAA